MFKSRRKRKRKPVEGAKKPKIHRKRSDERLKKCRSKGTKKKRKEQLRGGVQSLFSNLIATHKTFLWLAVKNGWTSKTIIKTDVLSRDDGVKEKLADNTQQRGGKY